MSICVSHKMFFKSSPHRLRYIMLVLLVVVILLNQGCSTFETNKYYSPIENTGKLIEGDSKYYIEFSARYEAIKYRDKEISVYIRAANNQSYIHAFGPVFVPIIPVFNFYRYPLDKGLFPKYVSISISAKQIDAEISLSDFRINYNNKNFLPNEAMIISYKKDMVSFREDLFLLGKHKIKSTYEAGILLIYDTTDITDNFVLHPGDLYINGDKFELPPIEFKQQKMKEMGVFTGPA